MKANTLTSMVLGTLLGLAATAELTAQTVYRVVDDSGNVSYTDRPPLTQQAGDKAVDTMRVQIKLTDPATVAANRSAKLEAARAEGIAGGIRANQAEEDAVEQSRLDAQRSANCEIAKQRFTKYSEARRLYRELDDGERAYLSSDEIDSERVVAADAVDEWCGN